MDGWRDEQVDRWTDDWMDGWWMDGWMDGQKGRRENNSLMEDYMANSPS